MTEVHSDAVGVSMPGGDTGTAMTMLEKAARALAIEAGHNHATIHHIRQVRAVLMTVREPGYGWIVKTPFLSDDAEIFTAMIDAILKEGIGVEP